MKDIRKRLLITSAILVVVLVMSEFVLRDAASYVRTSGLKGGGTLEANHELLIDYTGDGRRLVKNASVIVNNHYLSGLDVLIETNAAGFRAKELLNPKPADEKRVMVLGDSTTFGAYLPIEENYTSYLEQILQSENTNEKITVINAGIDDVGTREEIDLLHETVNLAQPDVVVLSFYMNDSRPSWGFAEEIRHYGWLRRHSVLAELAYNRLKLWSWIKEKGTDRFAWIAAQDKLDWKNKSEDLNSLIALARYDWGAAWDESSWPEIQGYFEKLKALSEQHNFRVILNVFPVSFQVYSNVLNNKPQERLAGMAAQLGFTYIDLLPVLRDLRKPDLFYDQCHPTAETYKAIAHSIAPSVSAVLYPKIQ